MSDETQPTEPSESTYPLGRGYGHDYMRGGEVRGGYGYSDRDEYERRRGDDGSFGGERPRVPGEQPAAEPTGGADPS